MASIYKFTAADIPPNFRDDAGVVGCVGARALQIDPRVSYCMYVPPQHYAGAIGEAGGPQKPLRLIVNVHGTERRAERARDLLMPFAEAHRCAVLAPLFPCSLGTAFDLDNYKTVRYGNMRFDRLLLAMLDEIAAFWPGIETGRVFMMGFSGGGQFTHRFLLLHPERLHAASIGAPGRPTRLDATQPWPQGISNLAEVFDGKAIDTSAMQRVRAVQLVIGERDTGVAGGGLLEWLALQEERGVNTAPHQEARLAPVSLGRTEMIKLVQKDLASCGVESQLVVVPGASHHAPAMLPAVCTFLESLMDT
jgi:pimeloyl-ACP methyl ester carboxylesterase